MGRFGLCCGLLLAAFTAHAQWTVVNLHPAGAAMSRAFAVRDGKQVGSAVVGDIVRASMWSGTAATWVDLSPVGQQGGSEAIGLDGPMQVGHASVGGSGGACYWTGTPGSWVDLHPAGSWSYIMDADAGMQVGVVGFGVNTAALWSGTPGSWINLHPPGAQESEANGIHAGQQVGTAKVGGLYRASLWTGTWDTWVDLHPAGASESFGWEIHAGQQVGWAIVGGAQHACCWRGTAASWVDLNPAGAQSSWAWDCHSGQQVGGATIAGLERASLWDSSAGSWRDLHTFVPPGFGESMAKGIWHDGTRTYVVGEGRDNSDGRLKALMWVSRSVEPASFSMFRGTVFSGNLASLINSDGNKLVLRPGVVLQSSEPPVQIRINATAPTGSPNGISFSVESSASFPFAQQKVSLWNYDSGAYELLDTRVVTTSDDTLTVTVRTNAQRFIDNGTLAMRALVSYKAVGPSILYPWSGRIDKAWWTFPG